MKRDSGRHAERGDAKLTPSEGCQSGPKASPERYRDTPTEAITREMIDAARDAAPLHAHKWLLDIDFRQIYTAMQAARSETPVQDDGLPPGFISLEEYQRECSVQDDNAGRKVRPHVPGQRRALPPFPSDLK